VFQLIGKLESSENSLLRKIKRTSSCTVFKNAEGRLTFDSEWADPPTFDVTASAVAACLLLLEGFPDRFTKSQAANFPHFAAGHSMEDWHRAWWTLRAFQGRRSNFLDYDKPTQHKERAPCFYGYANQEVRSEVARLGLSNSRHDSDAAARLQHEADASEQESGDESEEENDDGSEQESDDGSEQENGNGSEQEDDDRSEPENDDASEDEDYDFLEEVWAMDMESLAWDVEEMAEEGQHMKQEHATRLRQIVLEIRKIARGTREMKKGMAWEMECNARDLELVANTMKGKAREELRAELRAIVRRFRRVSGKMRVMEEK